MTHHDDLTPQGARLSHSEGTNILIVDDEDYMRHLLREVLEDEGFTVTLAESGEQALAMLEGALVNAIFTDVEMPGINGWELARAVRARRQDIAIAVLTGWSDLSNAPASPEPLADWVVTKPFAIEELIRIAREVAHRQSQHPRDYHAAA